MTTELALTTPHHAHDLAGMVALVDRFSLQPDTLREWHVAEPYDPRANTARMTVRWDHLTVTVRDKGDLALAQAILRERDAARRFLRTIVVEAATALGLDRYPFLHPAPLPRAAVKCHRCRTSGTDPHTPGSTECETTRRQRLDDHTDPVD